MVDENCSELLIALNVVSLSCLTDLLGSIHLWQFGLWPQVKVFKYQWALFLNEDTMNMKLTSGIVLKCQVENGTKPEDEVFDLWQQRAEMSCLCGLGS